MPGYDVTLILIHKRKVCIISQNKNYAFQSQHGGQINCNYLDEIVLVVPQ